MKKVLWMCNIVLPEFADVFDIPRNPMGGWISGMLNKAEKNNDIEIALAFPIKDRWRMKDGEKDGHPFFCFSNEYNDVYKLRKDRKERLREIVLCYRPDIIYIWGTEFPWSLEMVEVCKEEELLDNVIVHIQGLTSTIAKCYLSGVDEEYYNKKNEEGISLRKEKESFEKSGINEIRTLKMVKHVGGRTDWDRACCYAINPDINYHICDELLRPQFYKAAGSWEYDKIEKFSIFFSQAGYPIKGFHYLIKALPTVLNKYPGTHVYVGGNSVLDKKPLSPYGIYIQDLISRNNLQSKISFCGRLNVEDMISMYKKSNVFVSASSVENLCNSLAEAMIVGTPVISSFVGGTTSYIRHYENALVYPVNEIDVLAYYIIECFRDKTLCCNLSTEGKNTITEKGIKGIAGKRFTINTASGYLDRIISFR